jgi:uncharacterized protein (DUF302 family)
VSYHFSRIVPMSFAEAVNAAQSALKQEGFGVLAEIDMQAKFREKLGEEFRPYLILGACHPPSAFRAVSGDPHLGILMPCNVIVQQHEDGRVEVSAMNPLVALSPAATADLAPIAEEMSAKMRRVIDSL